MPVENKYVVVKSNKGAGLGDNLCSVFAGIVVATFYGRKLIVDWSDGSFGEPNMNVFPLLFDLSPSISTDKSLSELNGSTSVQPPSWVGNLLRHSYELYLEQNWDTYQRKRTIDLLSTDPQYFNSAVDILVITDFTRLPCQSTLKDLAPVVAGHIKPSQTIRKYLDDYISLNLAQHYIGIHVRMTSEKGAQEKSRKLSYYIQLLKEIRAENPSLKKIFLATDNASVINEWKNIFPDVVVRQKLMPKAGDPMHLTEFGLSRFEVTIDAVLDMLILSKGNFLLFPDNSAFSLSSAILSGLPSGNIYPIPFKPVSPFVLRLVSKMHKILLLLISKTRL